MAAPGGLRSRVSRAPACALLLALVGLGASGCLFRSCSGKPGPASLADGGGLRVEGGGTPRTRPGSGEATQTADERAAAPDAGRSATAGQQLGSAALPPGTPEQERSLQVAKGLALSGSCQAAEPHLEAVLAGPLTGAKISALLILGDCYRSSGRLQDDIAVFERARDLVPGVPAVHAALGRAYLEVQRDDEAVKSLRRALQLEPALLGSYTDLSTALIRLGRHKEAAEVRTEYERTLEKLIRQLEQGSLDERRGAVDALALTDDEQAVRALGQALADEDGSVRILAASALSDSQSAAALEALRSRLQIERVPEVITAMRQALTALESALPQAGGAVPQQAPAAPHEAPAAPAAPNEAPAPPSPPQQPAPTPPQAP